MARVIIDLPELFHFSTELHVRIGDINFFNHVGSEEMSFLMSEAGSQFLRHHGYHEKDVEGCSIIMADSAVIYKSEANHGDILTIDVSVSNYSKYGCDFVYRVTNKTTGKEVCRAKNGFVFADYETRELLEIPEKFKRLFTPADN
ncbi:MAG: thioesterase family protein [Deltaproteobacteria bacterium]|nr:thioesterase family protein [Deltaproteobacteria bacterium]